MKDAENDDCGATGQIVQALQVTVDNQDKRIAALEALLPKAVQDLTKAALDLIYADPHQWSTRGCVTCSAVSKITGRPFGCDRFRLEYKP